jgi:hypothetical protein
MAEILTLIRRLQLLVSVRVPAGARAEALELIERLVRLVVVSEYEGRGGRMDG